jgi:hypothetical protein
MSLFFTKYKKSIFCKLFDRLKTVLSTNIEKNNVNKKKKKNKKQKEERRQQQSSVVGGRQTLDEGRVPSDEHINIYLC